MSGEKFSDELYRLIDLEKYDDALLKVNEALNIYPKDLDFLEDKLLILSQMNDNVNLIGCCEEILEINPQYYNILRWRASAFAELNDCDNAVKTYDEALSYYTDDYVLIFEKVECLCNFNKFNRSREVFQEILEKYPDDSVLYDEMAKVYQEIGEYEMALDCYDNALALELDSAYMENKLICLAEYYNLNDDVYEELFDIIQEYDHKFLSEPHKFFGACKGIKTIDFKNSEEYLRFWE